VFYEQLKKACQRKGIALTNLLKEMGMSTGNTGKWKSGSMPSADVLNSLAVHLDVSVDFLLGNTDDPTPADKKKASPDEIEAELRRVLSKVPKDISPEKADLIVKLWQDIVDSVVDE
jgi:transcriptional regulator with XRE-family HTH domain